MPKVSFILPAYKRRFLKESVDSILAQTCRDFELVIVDDKSPEGLYEVIKEYKWEPTFETLPDGGKRWNVDGISVRYYQNAENLGGKDLVAAWKRAMTYATGEWCVLASDDDIYAPGYLEEMMRLVGKYPKVDLVHARLAFIDGNGEILGVGTPRNEIESAIEMTYARGVRRWEQTAPEFMFRKSAWAKIGGFVTFPCAWHSDDATWMALSRNGVCCSAEPLLFFRSSGINISSRHDDAFKKVLAGESFKKWMGDFSATLKPVSKFEELMLEWIKRDANLMTDGVMMWSMLGISFFEWRRCMKLVTSTGAARRRFFYYRWPLLIYIRKLIGFFIRR